jgi:hypothetical protein
MYHHIQMYLEQLGYDIVEVILLFEKVDQNHADMDELNTLNQLASAVYIHCQRHNLLAYTHPPTPFDPYELIEWFVFQSYDRVSLRYRIGTFLFIIVHHIIAGIYSNSLIVIEPPNP